MVEATSSVLVTGLAIALAVVHLFAGRLGFQVMPRSYWLSGAGGVSVAYVFVHVLPELGARQQAFADGEALAFLEHHVYLLALVGFAAFYGLEQLAHRSGTSEASGTPETSSTRETVGGAETETSAGIFWLHVGSFAAYNAIVGYLLVHREEAGFVSLAFFVVAMALHFVVNDHGLRDHHRDAYDEIGRWLLAGGIILNVVKELPEERRSNFWAFGGGAAAYAVLLLFL